MKTRGNRIITKILSLAICAAILFTTAPFCFADDDTPKSETIKVGFFSFDGYHMQKGNAKDGYERSGYGYDMLMHLAGYGGFNYEFIGYDKNWSEMQDMLANGEIDILTSAQKTPEREARFEFSETDIGISSAILTVKEGNNKYPEDDYENWSGIRVGMIKGNSRNDSFKEFAATNGFQYTAVYYDDMDEMLKDLNSNNKKIDAVLSSDLRKIRHEQIIAKFDASPFFIMVRKGDKELLDQINVALEQLDVCEPGLRTQLMEQYYSDEDNKNFAFNSDEKAYIKKMKGRELTAVINPDRAPYSYYENGKLTGISYDIAQEIIERTGLNIKFIEIEDTDKYYNTIEGKKADIYFEIFSSYSYADEKDLWVTEPFMTVAMSRLYLNDNKNFKTAAEPNNRDIAYDYESIVKGFGQEIITYPSLDETVDAILSGDCDISYLPIDTATMAIRRDETNRLRSDEIFYKDASYAIAINNNEDKALFSILNKAAASIGEKKVNAVRQNYISNIEDVFSLKSYFYGHPGQFVLGICITLGIVILIIIFVFQMKRRRIERNFLLKEKEQNEVLKDALEAAEKAGEAKSRFLSQVSHEMRTPLNAIIGFNELAKETDDKKISNYLASSNIAAKQLLDVINDVLDMSSIESGKLKISNTSFNLKKLIQSITHMYMTQCKQKGIEFETQFTTPVDEWIVGDELRINQILSNLIGNAVKFTDSGNIWLRISETSVDDNKKYLRFVVSDTGCGMSEDMKCRLFEPFEQENASTAQKYGGSGLGLSIVKNLVTMMEGSISVDSKQGEGSIFTVDLPITERALDDTQNIPSKVENLSEQDTDAKHLLSKVGSESSLYDLLVNLTDVKLTAQENGEQRLDFEGKRILLVEDNMLNQIVEENYFHKYNVAVEKATNGKEAVDMFIASEPGYYNGIFMDIQMPVMDGFEATKAIRASSHPEAKTIQIVAQTADAFAEDIAKCLSVGMNSHISKPISLEGLAKVLQKIFKEK